MNYTTIFQKRLDAFNKLKDDSSLVYGAKCYYKDRPVEFIEDWLSTYDPRNASKSDKPTTMPFILFPRQRDLVEWLMGRIDVQRVGSIEKCRDAGATETLTAWSIWAWLFCDGMSIGWGSRKELLVDRIGDPDSIFEKIRSKIRQLPKFFLPDGFNGNEHFNYMKVINPANGNTITGEAGTNIGRGGRKSVYFVDEAQPLNSKVLKRCGWVDIGSLKAGDKIIGSDGLEQSVLGVSDKGSHNVYEVTFSDKTKVRASENHIWTVKKRMGRKGILNLRTTELLDNFVYNSPKGQTQYRYCLPQVDPVRFDSKELPLNPYIVGVLLGDGSIKHVPKYRPKFTSVDPFIADEVSRLLPDTCKVTNTKGTIEYRLCDVKGRHRDGISRASKAIMDAGIAGHGAETKFIPDAYKYASAEDRLSLIQGLMDTDGSATGGAASFYTCSKQLMEDFLFVVRSLGGFAVMNIKPDARGYRDMYTAHISGIGTPFRLPRKINKLRHRKNKTSKTITNVKLLGKMPVRCITVSNDDGLYVTDDFALTHNSAHCDKQDAIAASLGDNTNVEIHISSVNGMNLFYKRAKANGGADTFIFDWRDDPRKDQAWYDQRKLDAMERGLLHMFMQEVERDYAAAVEGIMIKTEWLKACIDAHKTLDFEPCGITQSGVDASDEGGDIDACVTRKGSVVIDCESWNCMGDHDMSAGKSVDIANRKAVDKLVYDSIGVGAGFKNAIKHVDTNFEIEGWNAGGGVVYADERVYQDEDVDNEDKRTNKDFFLNAKGQGWWNIRERARKTWGAINHGKEYHPDELLSFCVDSLGMDAIDKLVGQLASPKMEYQNGKVKVESKQKMKDRGIDSPNEADGCVMAFVEAEQEPTWGVI